MYQGQTLRDNNGYEVLLFPLDCLYITQEEYGSLSHNLAMDFVGWTNQTGQIYNYPYYAPCTLKLVDHVSFWPIFESVNPVHLADGTIDYVTICFMHDNNVPYNVGDIIPQGQLLGHTGTAGGVGDHVHINTSHGLGNRLNQRVGTTNYYELDNSSHIYNDMFVNDTILYKDYGYNWRYYQVQPVPPTPVFIPKKKKYNFTIFNRQIHTQTIQRR